MPRLHSRRGISESNKIAAVEVLERRRLLTVSVSDPVSAETVVIGPGSATGVTFTASNGRYEGISTADATATLVFSGSAAPVQIRGHVYFPRYSVESVDSIVLTDAVPGRASLREIATPGTGTFDVGSISGGNLSSIYMPDVTLTESMDVASVTNMKLGAVSGAAINFGTRASSVKITGALSGSLTAGSLGSLSASEIMQEAISTTAPFSRSSLEIGSINAGAGLEQSEIISAGNIGSVRAGFIDGSVITAATNPPAATTGQFPVDHVPEYSSAFTSEAAIHSIQVVRGGTGGYFNNSVVAAYIIGSAQLAQMGATAGGVAAHTIDAIGFMAPAGSLNLTNLNLGYAQMKTVTRLEATLTARSVAFQQGLLGPDNILVLNLNLNVIG
jgi:hypothetical protein